MITKDKFWKFYTIPLISILLIGLTDIKKYGIWEYFFITLEILALLGYIIFLWNKNLFNKNFWKILLIIYILYMVVYEFCGLSAGYTIKTNTENFSFIITIIGIIINLPKIYAIFNLIKFWEIKQT